MNVCRYCGNVEAHRDGCSPELPTYVVELPLKPWTTNAERRMHRYERAAAVKQMRNTATVLYRKERLPKFEWCTVAALPTQRRGPLQDVAACNPAVKAAIDGLIDAERIADDTPAYLPLVTFLAPQRGTDGLSLYIAGPEKTS